MKEILVVVVLALVAWAGSTRSVLFGHSSVVSPADSLIINGQGTTDTTLGVPAKVTTSGEVDQPVVPQKPAVIEKTPLSETKKPVATNALPDYPLTASPEVAAGDTVTIPSVTFAAPGWVAIREAGVNQTFGTTLGASWLPAGTHKNVVVELLRPTVAGTMYFVVLHNDNGDKKYSRADDSVLTVSGIGTIAYGFQVK